MKANAQYEAELFALVKAPNIDYALIDKLLRAGVNIDCRDDQGRTPLFYAVATHNRDLYTHLIWKNADVTVKDNLGIALIDLVNKGEEPDFYYAIEDDNMKRQLHNQGVKVTGSSRTFDSSGKVLQSKVYARETESWTPLMIAIKEFDTVAAVNLMQDPKAIEAETFNGSTPLFFAIRFNNYDAMHMLISRGANLEHRNNNDLSLLGFAIREGSLESVKILVDAGVDTKVPCDDGLNGYRLALGYGKKEMADYIRYKR